MITSQQIIAITGKKQTDEFIVCLNDTLNQFKINTPLRICHFLAQILHESGCFVYTKEIASGDAYDTRIDLGNTPQIDGDGRLYKGRGLIQITGKANYKELSDYFKFNFISNPNELAKYPYAMRSAGWYWNKKGLNKYADKDDIKAVTLRINGGYNGLNDRIKWLNKCKLIIL